MTSAASGISTSSDRYASVKASVGPKPGSTPGCHRRGRRGGGTTDTASAILLCVSRERAALLSSHVDLVVSSVVLEVGLLRLLPAAKRLVNGEQDDLRERAGVLPGDRRVARTVVVAGD